MKEFKKLNYDEFLHWNKFVKKDSPAALEIKDGTCDYYIMELDDNMYVDLFVFKNDGNLVNLNICNALKLEFDLAINLLKEKYGTVIFKQDLATYGKEVFNKIKESYLVLNEDEDRDLNTITVDLTKEK